MEKVITGIETIKQEDTHSLILDELYLFNKEDIALIEEKTNLKIVKGMDLIGKVLSDLLEEIYQQLGEDLRDKEVLIVGNHGKTTKDIVKAISTKVRFITLVGDYDGDIENLIEEVLDETGLSIFHSKSIEKILTNYSIIINLDENPNIDIKKIRRQVIIFDFSFNGSMNRLINDDKEPRAIEDFVFHYNQQNIKKNQWIENLIPSYVYEYFHTGEFARLEKLCIDRALYDVEYFVGQYIKHRRQL